MTAAPAAQQTSAVQQAAAAARADGAVPDATAATRGRTVRRRPVRDERSTFAVLAFVLTVSLLGQRFQLPLGDTPVGIALVAAYAGLAFAVGRGLVRYDVTRTALFLAAATTCAAAAFAATAHGARTSTNSLLLLLVLWAPWCLTVRADLVTVGPRLGRLYVRLMVGIATLGVVQMLAQLLGGWTYEDYLDTWVPPDLLVPGYNTSIPIVWDSPYFKANAFLVLEPSFLSQLCALGILVALVLRLPAWQPLVLGLAMAAALSGTGIVLLAVGLVVVLATRRDLVRPAYAAAGAAAVAVVLLTPASSLLLERSGETGQQGSSGSLRFVEPFQQVDRGLEADRTRWVVGAGPGGSERLLESQRGGRAGRAVVYTIAPKLTFEYGLPAAVLFCGFIVVAVLRRPVFDVVPPAVVAWLFFLSGSLLQPHTVVLAWLLTSAWGVQLPGRAGRARRRATTARRP